MQFSLIDPTNQRSIVFPVNPEELKVLMDTKSLTYSPLKLGDVEVPRGRTPSKFTWRGFLPGDDQVVPHRHSNLSPGEIIDQLFDWHNEESKELRLIITGTRWNLPVLINTFEPVYSGGYGDVDYSISFTEVRRMLVRERNVAIKKRAETKSKSKTYTIKKNDTLWDIAKRKTGKGSRWPEMWTINKSKSRSKNSDLIYPGEVFTIPSGW